MYRLHFMPATSLCGKAVIIGNQGVSDVEIHGGRLGVTFMEKLGGGVVQTTTVAKGGAIMRRRPGGYHFATQRPATRQNRLVRPARLIPENID
jgi:hypothetical protein